MDQHGELAVPSLTNASHSLSLLGPQPEANLTLATLCANTLVLHSLGVGCVPSLRWAVI